MEDILASIRRIIASDQHIAGNRAAVPLVRQVGSAGGPDREAVERSARGVDGGGTGTTPVHAHPGEFPSLTDLDALGLPPAPIESEAGPAEDTHIQTRRESAVNLHEDLFPPPEDTVSEPVYELSPADRVSRTSEPESLISSAARASVSSSFHMLADSMVMRDPEMIERIARDTLRPMLKTWLDENLPSMVERLVRAEIERVARGGR